MYKSKHTSLFFVAVWFFGVTCHPFLTAAQYIRHYITLHIFLRWPK